MTGVVPPGYRRRPLVTETIDGIAHHWVWTPGNIHRSRVTRVLNYAGFAAAAATRALTLPRPDVVFVSSPPLPVAGVGPLLARRFGCQWLLEVRDIWPESAASVGWLSSDSRIYRQLEQFAHSVTRRARAVIVPTPGLEPLVRNHGAREIHVFPGVVRERLLDSSGRGLTRARLEIADDQCVFLYLGAIGVANGLDLLLDAVASLPSDVRARVVVAGDGSARRSIADALASRRLDRITLLPPVDQTGVSDLLAAADVGLHLLRPDPVFASALPTKALEYLGAGLPFVTTVPGLPSEVALAGGGAAVASVTELGRELARWAGMPLAERQSRGQRALRYGLDNFGLERNVDQFEALLEQIAAERRTTPAT
jgi:glycosyltransferase involved in cell wall biosynthesis